MSFFYDECFIVPHALHVHHWDSITVSHIWQSQYAGGAGDMAAKFAWAVRVVVAVAVRSEDDCFCKACGLALALEVADIKTLVGRIDSGRSTPHASQQR